MYVCMCVCVCVCVCVSVCVCVCVIFFSTVYFDEFVIGVCWENFRMLLKGVANKNVHRKF